MRFTRMGVGALLASISCLALFFPACGTAHRSTEESGPSTSVNRHASVNEVLASNRPSLKSLRSGASAGNGNGARDDAISAGRSLYQRRCVSCHQLHDPTEYSDGEWRNVVRVMARNAHLSSADEKRVLEYLQASN